MWSEDGAPIALHHREGLGLGNQPMAAGLAVSADGTRLLVTNFENDSVTLVDLRDRSVVAELDLRPGKEDPAAQGTAGGEYPFDVVFDGNDTAFVSSQRDREVVALRVATRSPCLQVRGRIALKGQPNHLVFDKDGGRLFVASDNSDTVDVADPERDRRDRAMMHFLRKRIHHVIYVVKENRTYDQLLGDLPVGNGDPSLAILGPYAPNHHRLASQFVTLDNFHDSGETSNTGWNWTTAARATDFTEKTSPVNYAGRGLTYDWEGTNRNINVGYADLQDRRQANPATPGDPDLLPGDADVAAPDGPHGEAGEGYLWNSALRAGLTIRNYGFYGDLGRYSAPEGSAAYVPLSHHPKADGVRQFFPTKAALMGRSDPYYRGYDNKYPDYWRVNEWEREFAQYERDGDLPELSLVRIMHDHFGNFSDAIDGVDTVSEQMADNDYALGRIVQRVAHSRYRDDTLIFVLEDDAQAGADHVDAHRSVGFIVGPYVRKQVVVSDYYTTVNMLRTMEDILGIKPLGLNDAMARPMANVFDRSAREWTYQADVPPVLRSTSLPLPAPADGGQATASTSCYKRPMHDGAYWSRVMRGQNFAVQDHLDTGKFNRAVWVGLRGPGTPYPRKRNGRNLRDDRDELIAAHREAMAKRCLDVAAK